MTPAKRRLSLEEHNELGKALHELREQYMALMQTYFYGKYPKTSSPARAADKLGHAVDRLRSEMDTAVWAEWHNNWPADRVELSLTRFYYRSGNTDDPLTGDEAE